MKRKWAGILILTVVLSLLFVGCEDLDSDSSIEFEDDQVLQPTYNEDLEEVSEIERVHHLDDFTLVTKYDTIDYDLNKWKITDNKTIRMQVWTEGLPSDWEAIIEHVHIDMFIGSVDSEYPSLLQDSMDDRFHGVSQDGFRISDNTKYDNIFGVIGASPELHSAVEREYETSLMLIYLREQQFLNQGYSFNKMQVIYDVMVKKPENDFYEPIAVYDEIIIPVGGEY